MNKEVFFDYILCNKPRPQSGVIHKVMIDTKFNLMEN